jgi:hypothetical protein
MALLLGAMPDDDPLVAARPTPGRYASDYSTVDIIKEYRCLTTYYSRCMKIENFPDIEFFSLIHVGWEGP